MLYETITTVEKKNIYRNAEISNLNPFMANVPI